MSAAPVPLPADPLHALVCLPCGRPKSERNPFCATCHAALPISLRLSLAAAPEEWFNAAARHLELNPVRRRVFGGPHGTLPYKSVAEFEQAGFKFSGYARCSAPRCNGQVMFFWTPTAQGKRRRICVDQADMQPHKLRCAHPEFYQRKRVVKTSARGRGA